MAIKVGGTEIVSNSRELKNIATIDSGTVTAFNSALNTDPTKGTLTKTFTQNETAEITLNSNVSVGPVVSATKEVPQTGISTKGNWDVNSTASNYDFHNTAANVTLTPSVAANSQVSSLSYANKTGHVNGNDTQAIAFKSDGTKVFVSGSSGNVYEHNLSTAWDLSTISYSKAFAHNGYMSNARGLYFKPDGTKFYIVGNNDTAFEFDINSSYPWDLSYASYNSKNININSQHGTGSQGIFFKPDGTKMFITDYTNDRVGEWSLSTAWDISTASHVTNVTVASTPKDIVFNSNGTVMYIVNASKVYEYNLSTGYDLSTFSNPSRDFTTTSETSSNQGLAIRPDDTEIFTIDGNDNGYEYNFGQVSTVALGSGSFASTDVGKRIVGNGGDVILTATSGTFSTTGGSAFTDSSTIAAGSWSMFGLKSAGDASGITITSGFGSGSVDIDQASETSNTYNFSGTTSQGIDVTFKPDGTKMYIADYNGNSLLEFNLSTAWDLTTASYVQEYAWNSSSYGTSTTSVAFKTDGTSFYILNYGDDKLIQISLSTAWSLSGASVLAAQTVSNSSWGSVSNPIGLVFSPDGTKIYMNGNTGSKTVQINLTSAWNISGGKTVAHTFSTSNQLTGPTALALNSDGTKIFIAEETNQSRIHQYSLSTAYDLSTISYDNKTLRTAASSTFNGTLYGTYYRPDTDIFYGVAYGAYTVNEFSLQSFIQPTAQYNVAVTNTSGRIDSSAFIDINSMTAAQSAGTGTVHYAVSTDGRTTWSVAKGTDGVRPIVRNNSGTWQYNSQNTSTQTGYDFSTFAYASSSLDLSSSGLSGGLNDITIKDDGTKIYFIDNNGMVRQHTLSTAYDLSTAGSIVSFNSRNEDIDPRDVVFKPDGTKMYVLGDHYNRVSQYALSTAWDVSTASYENKNFAVTNQMSAPMSVQFKSDGYTMYVKENTNIMQYTLSTAWDVSTASYANKSFSNQSQDSSMLGMFLKPDGTKMYTVGTQNDKIYEYNFGTAFDVATLSYSNNSYSLDSANGGARGITISSDGTKIYIADYDDTAIYQYNFGLSVPNFVTTPTWSNGTVNDELYTLQQALSIGANRMDKTQLDAIPDANHFSTGSSLDLMIALRMDTAASTLPTSDGVTLNYDAAALNEGAVLGTDYDFFHPAANKVQIKSLAAQNLKVRVV